MTDDVLRDAFARLQQARADDRAILVPLEEIAALAESGAGEAPETLARLAAVLSHPVSRAEYETLRALVLARRDAGADATVADVEQSLAPSPAAVPVSMLHHAPRRRWRFASMAAVAGVAAVGLAMLLPARPASAPVFRTDGEAVALVLPADGAPSRDADRFVWRAVPGAQGYVLRIIDADARPVVEQRLRDTVWTAGRDIPDAGAWQVQAEFSDGTTRTSRPRRLGASLGERIP